MPTEVIMPQMGESIFEGTISKWLKSVGDRVDKDEPLFEISTDKVDAEIPSPVAGVLTEVKAQEGETVQVNTVVAVIDGAEGGPTQAVPAPKQSVAGVSPPEKEPTEKQQPSESAPPPEMPAEEKPRGRGGEEQIRSSPMVRHLAKDNNVDLHQVEGTGLAGRVTKEDIMRHLSNPPTGKVTEEVSAAVPSEPAGPEVVPVEEAGAPETKLPEAGAATPQPSPGDLVPLTRMRSIIAKRMVESAHVSPHVYTVFKVDMSRIVQLREREKAGYEQRNGVKLTYMPFIAIAAIETLRKFPVVNASMENGSIRYHQNINLGIAVALELGLIVPVVRQAEERSFLGLARAITDLAERARSKHLKPEEASGSTFTLTNSGIFGEEFGTPIINQPEAAILAIGGLTKEPVVLTGPDGNDTIAIRSVQHFSMGFDHRIMDGADAGRFMREFKKMLENWDREIG
jgi:2-oxoglutarate dehydrogenase E2 component (dihydrolipoamide succinyltransferase)